MRRPSEEEWDWEDEDSLGEDEYASGDADDDELFEDDEYDDELDPEFLEDDLDE